MKRDWNLQTELDDLRAQGLWRELRVLDEAEGPLVRREGRALVNFSSNDYLGLCGSAELKTALQDALQRHGSGSGASRLVCGTHRAHAQFAEALAAFQLSLLHILRCRRSFEFCYCWISSSCTY